MNQLRDAVWFEAPSNEDLWEVTDRWGCVMRLHPYYLIDHNIIARGTYDLPLHQYIHRYVQPGMTVLDVGANIGSVALHLSRRVGPSGSIVCFEPVPHILERLRRNAAANHFASNIRIEELGVWIRSGTVQIELPPVDVANHGRASIQSGSGDASKTTITVTSLDDYVSANRLGRIDYIKFDIQGAEPAAISGAVECLRRFRPILLTEVSPKDLAAQDITSSEYVMLLERQGYSCRSMLADGQIGNVITGSMVPHGAHFANIVCLPI